MTMSEDRTSAYLDNARTFYFSNIIPQNAANNSGPWLSLEIYLGNLAATKEIYIVDGGAAYSGTLKGEGKIAIPTRTWKVAIIAPAGTRLADITNATDLQVIAVDMPNTSSATGSYTNYLTSVDAVEALTGYDLFSALPDGIEQIVEARRAGVQQYAMELQPEQISVSTTTVVNVVLLSSATFDATTVVAADTRLVTSTGTGVAPISRNGVVNTSVRDVDSDGRPDRIISFATSALRTAGFSASAPSLFLRPVATPTPWEAFDATLPNVVP